MTLIKSLLLGSAAGILAVASAQAADLPTKKGAPAVEFVKVCKITVAGKPVVGFTLPGSDTCMHFTGYITGQIEAGNLETGYSYGTVAGGRAAGTGVQTATAVDPIPTAAPANNFGPRPAFGYTTRLNFGADVVSNTAAGPLVGHLEMQFENGNGFDTTGTGAYINLAYVQWAGLTAGKAPSFFSFTGGGAAWANFFSPDQKGFNQPDVLAYTATTGGGFSATVALQSAGTNSPDFPSTVGNWGASGGGTYNGVYNGYYMSSDIPDIVVALALSQAWGSAQVSGVAHEVRSASANAVQATNDTWGFAVDAGVSFNLPSGPGDDILITGAYSYDATWYSGLSDAMWGENGAVNGNGQAMFVQDIGWNYNNTIENASAWSVTAEFDHHFNPQLTMSLEGSVGGVSWSNQIGGAAASDLADSTSWLIGFVGHYDPVTNLDFEIEVLYQNTHTDAPLSANPALWHANADGVAARFEVTRSW